jgi:hypothetical protein
MKIDVFCHIVPPKYKLELDKTVGSVAMLRFYQLCTTWNKDSALWINLKM